MKRIPSLDGFRAISIILVLISHSTNSLGFPDSLKEAGRYGGLGVSVFFVISGFLITYLLLVEEQSLGSINIKAFYMRRAFRILPVYLFYICVVLLWQNNIEPLGINKTDLIHALTFTMNFNEGKNWFVGHFWTLSIEEWFYLFWPALFVLFRKRLKGILIALIIYSAVARIIAYKLPALEDFVLAPFFRTSDTIFVGALGAIVFFERQTLTQLKVFSYSFLKVIAIILIITFDYAQLHGRFGIIALPFGNTISSFCILFLILAYITTSDSFVFKMLNQKILVHIGVLSYSLYVWQQLFFKGQLQFFRIFPYTLIEIYCVALLSYYLLERPFLKLKRHFERKKQLN
jgi:peptidoglycan/LPS O-acetylase OafA/YrhL